MIYHEIWLNDTAPVNTAIFERFMALLGSGEVRQTHHFEGRFENIYIDRGDIPGVVPVLDFLLREAGKLLERDPGGLKYGFWFNATGPGFRTAPHHHDENDELLSAVYYVRVPERSGALLLHADDGLVRVQPAEGKLVLFPPSVVHEVEKNNSDGMRLSIGMNVGPAGC